MPTIKLTEKSLAAIDAPTDAPQAYYWDDALKGFGVVVGARARTFVVQAWVAGAGRKRKATIGVAGQPRDDGHLWTVQLARQRAREILAAMGRGEDPSPNAPRVSAAPGRTLRDGYQAHLDRMRKRGRAERTIATFTAEVEKYLGDELDRSINDVDAVALHARIKASARRRAGSNPANDAGAPLANRVISHLSACWNSLNRQLRGALGTWNPAKSVERDVLQPKRERISDAALPGWYARVQTMRNPIQRDGLELALRTGLRSEDVRSIRFEHVDWDERTLALLDPKGGARAAFKIPLARVVVDILKRRQRDNATTIGQADRGYAFPAVNLEGEVGPVGDLRQQTHDGDAHGRFPVEDVHTLRRTWESIGHESGISDLDLHVLSNHTYSSRNVHESYIAQHLPHLAKCAATIDAAITARLGARRRGRTKLRAVP